jgi:general secretion pathway protein F
MNAPALAPARAQPAAPRLSRASRAALVRELATLVAVMPITDAVDTLARQPRKPREAAALAAANRALLAGRPLAIALPAASFPADLRATIAAGEASGRLPALLARLADSLEADMALRSRLLASLAYPALLVLVAIAVIVAMLLFVVPGIAAQYADIGAELPGLTRFVLALSDGLGRFGPVLLVLLLAAVAGAVLALRRPALRLRLETWLLRLPLVGPLFAASEAVRYARLLGVMLSAGLPLAEALLLVGPALSTAPWRQAVQRIAADVRSGQTLSGAMLQLPGAPGLLLSMARSGEVSGRLAVLLDSAAATLDRQLADRSRALLALVEPIIILLLGGMVGTIILAVLLPILRLNALAGQALGVS